MFAPMRSFARGVLVVCTAFVSAQSLAGVVQVLDSVDAFGRIQNTESSTVLEMGFRDPLPRKDFFQLALGPASGLIACQRAADQGLYCLDGPVVRYWPNTAFVDPATGVIPDTDLINCRQSAAVLGLDRKAAAPCTSLTVDLNGAIWLAGRKANSHSLFKVVERTGASCPLAYVELPPVTQDAPTPPGEVVPVFCAREYAFGRPVLVDINPVDGEVAGSFTSPRYSGPGVLGLEERKTVAFFPDVAVPLEPDPIASGKSAWNLIGNEQLLSATVLQIQEIPDSGLPLQNFVIAATTLGRVMATKSDGSAIAFEAWRAPTCTSRETQQYGVRVSSQSERVYLSDRACQKVYALKWTNVADGSFTLEPATEGTPPQQVALATKSVSTSVLPDGLSVAPGIGVDLRDCGFNADGSPKTCVWVADGTDVENADNTFNAAEVSGVRIENNGKSKMTVFQVIGIPDCRYWPEGPGCDPSLVDGDTPEEARLNITELLPQEVKLQYPVTGDGALPPLWISAKYRGQVNKAGKRTIDLFWAIPEPGVQFRDTFRMSFDVGDLADGVKNGCGGNTDLRPDVDWNVIITGSEKYVVVDGDGVNRSNVGDPYVSEGQIQTGHVETLVNDGCFNPDGVSSKRFSYYAYNLELTPDLPGENYSDGIYAHMVLSLFDDILSAQRATACKQFDPYPLPPLTADGNAPLNATQCANLEQKWFGADDKLKKCISGTTFPRQSEAVNNCNSFLSQLGQYESALNAAPRYGQDPANRIGELKARVKVLRYVFQQHFVPSIPPNGFCSLTATQTCAP